MLNEIINAILKLLTDETGAKAREALTAIASGGELPYGTAISSLVKQQTIVDSTDVEQIIKLLLTLLGAQSQTEKQRLADGKRCADCPYCSVPAKTLPAAPQPEKAPMEFDLDRAPTTRPCLKVEPDASAAAETALERRIRALAAQAAN